MPRPAKRSNKEPIKAKLKRLENLARATARLSAEVFRDLVSASSVPVPPKPKKSGQRDTTVMMGSVPVPPKPKFEALADLAYGAGVIEQGAEALGDD
jgi:hypothetical protein